MKNISHLNYSIFNCEMTSKHFDIKFDGAPTLLKMFVTCAVS